MTLKKPGSHERASGSFFYIADLNLRRFDAAPVPKHALTDRDESFINDL